MPLDVSSPRIIEWLAQFELEDQPVAAQLLSEIYTVDANELAEGLRAVILEIAEARHGPVALYAERHIRRQHGKPDRMFKETRAKPRRSYGNGPPPVPAGRPYAHETGSEGIIATLITGLVRADKKRFLDHPGPDEIRKSGARSFVVVTDFVGSGRRVATNLEAAWKVYSFKSWRSYGHLRFAVASYSGTEAGVRKIQRHRSQPSIHLRRGCPTLWDLDRSVGERIIELCRRYGPARLPDDRTALGYGDTGGLIAFDHGIPNNAPLLLHTRTRNWIPLFTRRSAALMGGARREVVRAEEIDRSLQRLREKRLAAAPRFANIEEDEQNRVVVLTALKRRPRTLLAISTRTALTVTEVRLLVERAQADGYVDNRLRLTPAAYNALNYLRTSDLAQLPLLKTNETPYCPESLRSPRKAFR